jgi:hypothetical protein
MEGFYATSVAAEMVYGDVLVQLTMFQLVGDAIYILRIKFGKVFGHLGTLMRAETTHPNQTGNARVGSSAGRALDENALPDFYRPALKSPFSVHYHCLKFTATPF